MTRSCCGTWKSARYALAEARAETACRRTHRGAEEGFGFLGQAADRDIHAKARDRLRVPADDRRGDRADVGSPFSVVDGESPVPDRGQVGPQFVRVDEGG